MPDNGQAGGRTYRALIDAHPLSSLQWTIFVLCFLIMLLDGFDTVLVGFLAPFIGAQWHLPRPAMTPVFTAGVAGLMLAGCVAGILADRIGRRPLLIGAAALFGAANLATAFVPSVDALIALRFVTGLGLGAAMPCAVALVSEYAPARRRALIVTTMYCGYTLGGAMAGWLTPLVVPHVGWRGMFVVGAALPLALLPMLLWRLPESIAFLAERRADVTRVVALLQRITARDLDEGEVSSTRTERSAITAGPLRTILSPTYRLRTALLWIANGCGLMMMFSLINWLPSFLTFKSIPAPVAATIAGSLQIGGALGAVVVGWLIDRCGARRVVTLTYLAGALAAWLWGPAIGADTTTLLIVGLLTGIVVFGGQTGFQVLATTLYPVTARATGLSWMQSIGRLGGILGIQLAGYGVAREVDPVILLGCLAVPAVLASLCAVWLGAGDATSTSPDSHGVANIRHPRDVRRAP
ncbi:MULTISPECIES: MFS transporter [Pandoraea]|uniref:MFS transporter n=1 Tax=Pandoraea TaxID=93217 RepID=UPI001F5D5D83|nr:MULTISPECIES: MFS transporter [Pandoraea]